MQINFKQNLKHFISPNGNSNTSTKVALLIGDCLGFDGIKFRTTVVDKNTLKVEEFDTQICTKDQLDRLAEYIVDAPILQKPTGHLLELDFRTLEKINDQHQPLKLEMDIRTPYEILMDIFDEFDEFNGPQVVAQENQDWDEEEDWDEEAPGKEDMVFIVDEPNNMCAVWYKANFPLQVWETSSHLPINDRFQLLLKNGTCQIDQHIGEFYPELEEAGFYDLDEGTLEYEIPNPVEALTKLGFFTLSSQTQSSITTPDQQMLKNIFGNFEENKSNQLKSDLEKKLDQLLRSELEFNNAQVKLNELKAEIKLLNDRLFDLEQPEPFNGYYFNISERNSGGSIFDESTMEEIARRVSKVREIILPNFLKLFEDGKFTIRIGKKNDLDQVVEIEDYSDKNLFEKLNKYNIQLGENCYTYGGELGWGKLSDILCKIGFSQDSNFDKFCGSNSY